MSAGIEAAIGNHSFRAIGITDYLENGGDINIARRMAGHSKIKTTELYDRRGDDVSFSENQCQSYGAAGPENLA
jgi:integrase/recombinase XerD